MKVVFFTGMLLLSLFWSTDALAYIDPGSGSMLVQLLITGALGAVFYLRKFLAKLFAPFFKQKNWDKDE